MELKIRYRNGEMVVLIDEFLNVRNITKFRKLLKIIDKSYTPEARDVLKNYITNYLAEVDEKLKHHANKAVDARTEYKEQKILLEDIVYKRDRFKRNTQQYKLLMENVKQKRERLRHLKVILMRR